MLNQLDWSVVMNIGDTIPTLVFHGTSGLQAKLGDFHGQWVVLYFYPKDATPGCTLEGQDFRDHFSVFLEENAIILGVSRDRLTSHETFKAKQQLPFELISDTDEALCELFSVIKIKSMYGKQARGIERSTFIIDPTGVLRYEYRGVRVKGHVLAVLAMLKKLQSNPS